MSAIWGMISFDNEPIDKKLFSKMKRGYEDCVIDRFEEHIDNSFAFGCGIQHITKESRVEALPIIKGNIAFAADVIIDNREDLMDKLGTEDKNLPDGNILFEMFNKYKANCLNDLLGAYSFVFYDSKANKVSIAIDSTGNRCLYYYLNEEKNILYFSSLIKPLADIIENVKPNEKWITIFLSADNLAISLDYEETIYENIFRVSPSQIIEYDGNVIEKTIYWNPKENIKELKLSTDEEYTSRLDSIFRESVSCLLRGEKNGMLLSGGMDSTAAACYAAPYLKSIDKTLYTFTYVPEKDYKPKTTKTLVEDETEKVLLTKEFLEKKDCKIESEFLDLPSVDGWCYREDEVEKLEMPYKSIQNILNIKACLDSAHNKGVRILLDAGYGNITISAIGIDPYLKNLLELKDFIGFIKENRKFIKNYGFGRKKEVKIIFKYINDYCRRVEIKKMKDFIGNSYVNKNLLEKYNIKNLHQTMNFEAEINKKKYNDYKSVFVNRIIFCQRGEIYTKHSLKTGVLQRDPTMDKRLIEFCMSLPPEQFAKDGVSRRLVRTCMSDKLPKHAMEMRYGHQSADTIERLEKKWDIVYPEILNIFEKNIDSIYIDSKKAISDLEIFKEKPDKRKTFDILRLCYTAMLIEFVSSI